MRRPHRYCLARQQIKMSMHPANCYNMAHYKLLDEQNLNLYQINWKSRTLCRLYYNGDLQERSFRRVYERCNRNIYDTLTTMERRLENVVFRSLFSESIFSARKMVSDGAVLLNGKVNKNPSTEMQDGDILQISKERLSKVFELASNPWIKMWAFIPKYLEVSHMLPGAVFIRQPEITEIPSPYPLKTVSNMAAWYSKAGLYFFPKKSIYCKLMKRKK
jgi:small subunit ribosomal protein S4